MLYVTCEIKSAKIEIETPGEGRGGIIEGVGVTEWDGGKKVCDEVFVCVELLVPVHEGVGVGLFEAVPVPVILGLGEIEGVIDGEVPIEMLAVGVGLTAPVTVFEGEVVIDGVPVGEPVIDEVSELLIVDDGVVEEVAETLLDIDIDAPKEKVEVGETVTELLRLVEVEGV